jgi:hypothetical protein
VIMQNVKKKRKRVYSLMLNILIIAMKIKISLSEQVVNKTKSIIIIIIKYREYKAKKMNRIFKIILKKIFTVLINMSKYIKIRSMKL